MHCHGDCLCLKSKIDFHAHASAFLPSARRRVRWSHALRNLGASRRRLELCTEVPRWSTVVVFRLHVLARGQIIAVIHNGGHRALVKPFKPLSDSPLHLGELWCRLDGVRFAAAASVTATGAIPFRFRPQWLLWTHLIPAAPGSVPICEWVVCRLSC